MAITEHSTEVHSLDHSKVMELNVIAQALVATKSLNEAENVLRDMGRESEIDHERKKATKLREHFSGEELELEEVLGRISRIEADAQTREVDFLSLRRLAEALDLPNQQVNRFRAEVSRRQFPQYFPPLWLLDPNSINLVHGSDG